MCFGRSEKVDYKTLYEQAKVDLKECQQISADRQQQLYVRDQMLSEINQLVLAKDQRIRTLEEEAASLIYPGDRQVLITSLQGNEIWVPVDLKVVALRDGDWVKKVLAAHGADALKRLPMDSYTEPHYRIPPYEFMLDYLAWNLTDEIKYELSLMRVFDCDKFTRKLWGEASGDTDGAWNNNGFSDDFSGGHAYFGFLSITPQFFYYDETTSSWVDLGEQQDGSDGEFHGEEPQTDRVWLWDREAMTDMYDAESGVLLL